MIKRPLPEMHDCHVTMIRIENKLGELEFHFLDVYCLWIEKEPRRSKLKCYSIISINFSWLIKNYYLNCHFNEDCVLKLLLLRNVLKKLILLQKLRTTRGPIHWNNNTLISWNTVHERVIVFLILLITVIMPCSLCRLQVKSETDRKTWTPSINKKRSFTSILHCLLSFWGNSVSVHKTRLHAMSLWRCDIIWFERPVSLMSHQCDHSLPDIF